MTLPAHVPVKEAESVRESEEQRTARIWTDVTLHWAEVIAQNPRGLAALVRRGVPDMLRTVVWPLLIQDRDRLAPDRPLIVAASYVPVVINMPSYPELVTKVSPVRELIESEASWLLSSDQSARETHRQGRAAYLP